MAELAGSVAGLLSLAISLIDISHTYFSSLKNSTKTVKRYFRELDTLRLLLDDFNSVQNVNRSSSTVTAVNACHLELETLYSRLQKRTTNEAFSNALHRLRWPFAEEETRHFIEVIHRYLDIFHAALTVENAKLASTTLEAIQAVESRVIDTERKNLLRLLSSVDPYSNHVSARDKHSTTTGDWFLKSTDFLNWLEQPHGALWLVGIPGAGKTILCSTAMNYLLKSRGVNEAVLIWYFDFGNDEKQTLQSLLRCLLRQTCELLDEIPPNIAEAIAEQGSRKAFNLDPQLLTEFLKQAVAEFDSVVVVIDALDESCEVQEVLDALRAWLSADFLTVKWLLTSRRKSEIQEELESLKVTAVTLSEKLVGHDIRQHVAECLRQDSKLRGRPARIKDEIEFVLTKKSKGMFRWVDCQLQVIRRCRTAPAINAALASLPETLDITYERILQSISSEDREHARSALELLAFSRRPMRLEEVAEAVVVAPGYKAFDMDDRLFDPKDIISICAGLVDRVHETNELVLAHYSVKEFLLSGRISQREAAFFWMERNISDIHIAEKCLTYLISLDDLGPLYLGIEDDCPFLEYASVHWLSHVPESDLDADARLMSLITNLTKRWDDGPRLDWTQFYDPDIFYEKEWGPTGPSAIALLCSLRRENVAYVHHRLQLEHIPRDCAFLLETAIRGSNYALVKQMVDDGCSLDLCLTYRSPLCTAVEVGNDKMVELLLSLGAKASGRVPEPWNQGNMRLVKPLTTAAVYRRLRFFPLLLRAGADVNETDGRSVLSELLSSFEDRAMSLEKILAAAQHLVDAGADVNSCSPELGSVIHMLMSKVLRISNLSMTALKITAERHGNIKYGLSDLTDLPVPGAKQPMILATLTGNEAKVNLPRQLGQQKRSYLDTLPTRVRFLLARGADPNRYGTIWHKDIRFHQEVEFANKDMTGVIHEARLNRRWESPLQAACTLRSEAVQIVRILLEYSVDLTQTYRPGESPVEMARANGYMETVKILEDAIEKLGLQTDSTGMQVVYSETHHLQLETEQVEINMDIACG